MGHPVVGVGLRPWWTCRARKARPRSRAKAGRQHQQHWESSPPLKATSSRRGNLPARAESDKTRINTRNHRLPQYDQGDPAESGLSSANPAARARRSLRGQGSHLTRIGIQHNEQQENSAGRPSSGWPAGSGCSQAPDGPNRQALRPRAGQHGHQRQTRRRLLPLRERHWLATAKIPDDRPADGASTCCGTNPWRTCGCWWKGLDGKAAAGTPAQQIHDLYQSYLDQTTRNAKGTTPLLPMLSEIEQIRTPE